MKEKTAGAIKPGRRRFIDRLGLYYENYGIPRIGGRIIGLIITAEAPVTAGQIAAALSVSRGSVSTNLRLLLLAGFLEVSPEQAGRADRYVLAVDAWQNAIRARVEGFKTLKAIAAQGIEAIGGQGPAQEKLREMADWADAMIGGHEHIQREWMGRRKSGEKR